MIVSEAKSMNFVYMDYADVSHSIYRIVQTILNGFTLMFLGLLKLQPLLGQCRTGSSSASFHTEQLGTSRSGITM